MKMMSMFFRGKRISVPEHWRESLAWTLLVLAFAAGFAMGRFTGHDDVPTPIVIERSGELGN